MINFIKTETDADNDVTYNFTALITDYATFIADADDYDDYIFELAVSLTTTRTDIVCENCDATNFANRPFLYQSDGRYGIHLCFEHLSESAQKTILDKIASL